MNAQQIEDQAQFGLCMALMGRVAVQFGPIISSAAGCKLVAAAAGAIDNDALREEFIEDSIALIRSMTKQMRSKQPPKSGIIQEFK